MLGSISIPASSARVFSGISPTLRSSVSTSKYISLPLIGCLLSSTFVTSIRSSLSRPYMLVTVWDRYRGIPKSSRHCFMLRGSPLLYGISSATPSTSAPSRLMRRAIMSPISPEPSMNTFFPTIYPSILRYLCACPAV